MQKIMSDATTTPGDSPAWTETPNTEHNYITPESTDDDESPIVKQQQQQKQRIEINKDGDDVINVIQITWNMQGKYPSIQQLDSFLSRNSHHIYCFVSEECERAIEKSILNSSKAKWESVLTEFMSPDYVMLGSCSLMALHIAVFVHHSLLPYISASRTGNIACGVEVLYNNMGNKGAVYVSFFLGKLKFLFIGTHLPAGQEHSDARNASYHKIISELNLEVGKGSFEKTEAVKEMLGNRNDEFALEQQHTIFTFFDYIFWAGDLNYRVNGNRSVVDKLLSLGMMEVLLSNDQLTIERNKGNVFQNFQEGSITFPPTYKFSDNSDVYDDSKKKRIPAWTDRILFFQKLAKNRDLKQLEYGAEMKMRLSDHRPVHAKFEARVNLSQFKKPVIYDDHILALIKEHEERKKKTVKSQSSSSVCMIQ